MPTEQDAAPATTSAGHGALAPLAVLADPQRRAILEELARGPVCTCTQLVETVDASQPTVSHHLKVLREAGLVVGERCGRYVEYAVVPDALRRLADALTGLALAAERGAAGARR